MRSRSSGNDLGLFQPGQIIAVPKLCFFLGQQLAAANCFFQSSAPKAKYVSADLLQLFCDGVLWRFDRRAHFDSLMTRQVFRWRRSSAPHHMQMSLPMICLLCFSTRSSQAECFVQSLSVRMTGFFRLAFMPPPVKRCVAFRSWLASPSETPPVQIWKKDALPSAIQVQPLEGVIAYRVGAEVYGFLRPR